MRCPKCGLSLGAMQVHPAEQCERQQEKNRKNLGIACSWCGSVHEHKEGCPADNPFNKPRAPSKARLIP